MRKILILAANPKNTNQLRLDEEVREIQEGLQRSRSRDQFEIVSRWAVRPSDLRRALLDYEPQIVHFCGHGAGAEGLALENNAGQIKLVTGKALGGLFKLVQANVECVLLNACYSEAQSKAIHKYISYVIGMSNAIGDRAAIEFAVGFYDGLGADRSYEDAFEFGLSAIALEGIDETATPKLKSPGPGSSPNSVQRINPSSAQKPESENKTANNPLSGEGKARIFISYKRDAVPDEQLALAIYQHLGQSHEVFIDQSMAVGTKWAEKIERELRQSDFLITLLSASAVGSEMVQGEVETANRLGSELGKPAILPVRVNYREPFTYPLSAYLNPINWAFWEQSEDTPQLLAELERAIAGESLSIASDRAKQDLVQLPTADKAEIPQPLPSAQPPTLEMPEGSMDPESQFYVERQGDQIALAAIQRQGVTVTIKGPRQMGKSSLLLKTVDQAIQADKRVAYIDFQLFDDAALGDADRFYQQFCLTITEQLELPNRIEDFWQDELGNNQRCTRYMQTYVLRELKHPFVLAMDEVDRIFDRKFRSDFFAMLRNWHNNRGLPLPAMKVWKQFDLVLVTATEPYHLIADLHQSPFNVGEVISLKDFTAAQVADLNQRHGSPLTAEQERALFALLNGHPYLIRKALYLVASGQKSMDQVLAKADRDDGPFGDHLRYHLFRIYDRPELVQGMLGAVQKNRCEDERIVRLLCAAGLIRQEGKAELPRCQLYGDYFKAHLE
ncbi:AAA-like domain-containing protein [Acaryochloris marina]|uniref:TIR domain-containing protein n=1 Tax=Acaryochloris marina (strain MBIC 11017) TaxID=329726 RepID=B0C5U4_ACAM1|nr:AAA-like domain-containing protein [Acaryochloris marina]ABW29956.1 conserved hypothetical protein [Acaryochloris marina MBIC11017]